MTTSPAENDYAQCLSRRLVDPQLLAYADAMPRRAFTADALPALRARPADYDPPIEAGVSLQELSIAGPAGAPEVRMLVLVPENLPPGSPALLYIHGGGYVMGRPEQTVGWCSKLAKETGCVAFLPSYRLAPETKWQGAIADLYVALEWVRANAGRFGAEGARLAIGGASAGGGHAAALALYAHRLGGPPILYQLLMCPMLDDRQPADPYAGEYVWTREIDRFGWQSLLGMEPGGGDVPAEAVPGRVADLSGLPPAFIEVGALELFAESCLDYARRLMSGGVPVELHLMPGAYHGFEFLVPNADVSRFVRDAAIKALKTAFAR